MKPGGGGAPPKPVEDALASAFGSIDAFKTQFKEAAVAQFGSGWAWLVTDGNALKVRQRLRAKAAAFDSLHLLLDSLINLLHDASQIVKTPNAVTPIVHGQTPLMTCDVWEHAYYLDHQNRRAGATTRGAPRACSIHRDDVLAHHVHSCARSSDFVQAFLDHLVSWEFVEKNMSAKPKL